jgi:hypothetical protein
MDFDQVVSSLAQAMVPAEELEGSGRAPLEQDHHDGDL